MTVTASIVVHRSPLPQLRKAVECILRADVAHIFIIDNSPDNTLSAIATLSTRIEYSHVENHGFGAGHNIALRRAISLYPGGYHLVMNADVWWEGDALTPLARYLDDHPDTGMIAPRVYYPDGRLQYSCRMLPTPGDMLARRLIPSFLTRRRMRGYLLADADHSKAIDCPYLLGSFLLFRNRALEECGLFDERFFMYPEDIDITRRIHRRWRTLYWPGTDIIHQHAAASRRNPRMFAIHLINMARYFNKWGWLHDEERDRFNSKLLNDIREPGE